MKKLSLIFALVCLCLTAHAQTNPPAGSNLALVPASSWTNTTGTLATTGIADTIGGTNAGRLSNSSSQGTTYVVHSLSQTVSVGDVFMAGVWTRLNSGSTGTGFPGTITLGSCTATIASTGYSSSLALPTPSTTSTFQWTSVAVKVVSVSGNPCSVSFSLSSPPSAVADFFAPVFFYIPIGTMQDNQILTQSQSLQNYSLTCTTPATTAPPSGCVPVVSSGSGITQVSSLPATCTNSSSTPVQMTASLTVGSVTYGAGTVYYCDSTNHYSPVSQGSGASPVMGFYLSPQCPPSNQANCFYTPADTQQAVDCSWTATSTTVNCASSHFTQADVGKQVMGFINCEAEQTYTTNAAAQSLVNAGTGARVMFIQSVQSGTQLTTGGFAADNTSSGNTHCLVWGHPDDSYFAAVDTALQSAPSCPKLFLAAGYYFLTAPHFFTQPTGCNNLGTNYLGSAANTVYAAGFEIEGRGTGNTVLFLANDFPEAANGNCTKGNTNLSCFIRTQNGRWHDFQITGGQNTIGPAGSTVLIEVVGPGSIDNFTCTNMGSANTNSVGMWEIYWDRWYQVNNSGCGYTATETGSGGSGFNSQLIMYKYRAENNAVGLLHQNSGGVYMQDAGFLGSYGALVSSGLIQNTGGGIVGLFGWFNQIAPLSNPTGVVGYLTSTTAGGILYADRLSFNPGTTFNFTNIKCTVQCYNILSNVVFSANGTGNTISDGNAASVLRDLGNNVNQSSGAGPNITGLVYGSPSISYSPLVTGNVAISSCGTSTASLFSGSSQKGQFTITFAGTPGTTCTATVTFPTAFFATPVCTWYNQGGTNSLATVITQGSAATKTSTAATFSGPTFTNGNTIIVQYECSNP